MSIFDFVKAPKLQKFEYNLNNQVKLSGRIGDLIPFQWEYLSPGDSIRLNSELFMRTAPLIHPIFQKLNVDVHHFFIPLRLIWSDFETFITGFNQQTAEPNDSFQVPQFKIKGSNLTSEQFKNYVGLYGSNPTLDNTTDILIPTSLADYLGIPCSEIPKAFGYNTETNSFDNATYQAKELSFSLLPFRAYQQVFNDYYRDSIKEPLVEFDKDSNNFNLQDVLTSFPYIDQFRIRHRALEKDYFTTSQPTPQLGNDVSLNSSFHGYSARVNPAPSSEANLKVSSSKSADPGRIYAGTNFPTSLQVNIDSAVITTINKLRELFSLQRWADTGNKFGSRYREQTLGHFGVETPDARLQRAQFLGGGRIPVMINQVSQLSEGSTDSPLGTQAGQGMAYGEDNSFEFEALEHGIILSIVSVIPENSYYKGIPRKFLIRDRFDFPFPEFATLGEQEVSSQEINILYSEDETFGYQERYAEFKSIPNRVAGEFTTSLRNFYLASPQSESSCLDDSNIRVKPDDYDNVFPTEAHQADNLYFLISNKFTKFSPLPYINRVTTDLA